MTIAGAIAMLLSFLADRFNVKLPYTSDEIKQALIVILGVGGFLVTLYGRYRHGDINILGFKKPVTVSPFVPRSPDEIE